MNSNGPPRPEADFHVIRGTAKSHDTDASPVHAIDQRLQQEKSHTLKQRPSTFYNFCRVHSSLRVTPCMAAGIADRIWSLEEMLHSM
jgi:hypothetical protein